MPARILIIGTAVLAAVTGSAQAGLLDFFLGPSHGGNHAGCTSCSTGHCADGQCGATGGDCYNGHLPCCADVRGSRDRWRLWHTKKCREIHHESFYPPVAPLFHPTWGYHQTCWRRFPPLPPCPPADAFLMPYGGCETGVPGAMPPGIVPPQPVVPGYESPVPPPAPVEPTAPDATGENGGTQPYVEPDSEPAPAAPLDDPLPPAGDARVPDAAGFVMPRNFGLR